MRNLIILLCFITSLQPLYGKLPTEIKGIDDLFTKYSLRGSILIYDLNNNEYLSNDIEKCNLSHSPASTFKIANTLIAFETGAVTLETIFKWDGKKRHIKAWETDMNIETAYKVSCVPVYQEVARQIGLERMQEYIKKLNYGNMDIHKDNLDKFWLEGDSKITQYQQIYFLKQLYESALPMKEESMGAVRKIMIHEQTEEYTIRAKTGWAVRDRQNTGWFVGYVEANDNVYFFATCVEPTTTSTDIFAESRITLTKDILRKLNIIK
jgi:beta-lactamase class D